MCNHLRYSVMVASIDCNEDRHPIAVMEELGITYKYSYPITVGSQWWFCHCENIPYKLPEYITLINQKSTLDQIKIYIKAEQQQEKDNV